MGLYARWSALSDEFDLHLSFFRHFAATRPTLSSSADFTLEDECALEGHLSRVWQAWCGFCRWCVCESCLGTTDGNGVSIVPHPEAISEHHVSSAAKRAKEGKTPSWRGANVLLRQEPTWGDTDVLATIVQRIQPSNSAQLLPAISSAHQSAKAIQRIRNASAHLNSQSLSDISSLQISYIAFSAAHPVHALYWIEPSSQDFLIASAIEELRDAALAAIS